jgi:hypothetical protein
MARIATLEEHWRARPVPEKGDKGDPGPAGKDADVQAIIAEVIKAIPEPVPGLKGERGDVGEPGKDGRDGVDGKDGLPGKDGPQGLQGGAGRDGKDVDEERVVAQVRALFDAHPKPKDGAPGERGAPGKDVDEAVVRALVAELTAKAVSAIPAPKDGRDGKDIDPETLRETLEVMLSKAIAALPKPVDGRNGTDGKDGRDGRDGKDARESKDGKDGDPGRDAPHVVPLVGIDPARSYPRGTWANYRGGMFFTVRASDPFAEPVSERTLADAGWACAFDGIYDEIEEYQDEGRRIEKTTVWASGRTKKITRIGRSVLYRGVYRPDVEYRCGDQVTWGGSQWHCQVEATKERPGGGSPDWVLAVKQGDPGKAAKIESTNKPVGQIKLT